MRNEHALMGIYAPFALPAGVIIPDEVQDYIREQMIRDIPASMRHSPEKIARMGGQAANAESLHAKSVRHKTRMEALTPKILELRRSGMPMADVARAVTAGVVSVREICAAHGLSRVSDQAPYRDRVGIMVEMRQRGATCEAIAQRVGCSAGTVEYWMRKTKTQRGARHD